MLVYLLQLAAAHLAGWSWSGILAAALTSASTVLLPLATTAFFAAPNDGGGRVPFLFRRNNNGGNGGGRGRGLLCGLAIAMAVFLLWTNFWLTTWWAVVCFVAVRFLGIAPNLLDWKGVAVFGTVTFAIAYVLRRIQRRYVDDNIGRAVDYCSDRLMDGAVFLATRPFLWARTGLRWTVLSALRGLVFLARRPLVWARDGLQRAARSTFSRHRNERETETAHDWNDHHHLGQETDTNYDWNDYGFDDVVEQETASYYDWNDEVEQEAAFHTPIVTAKKAPATLRRSARIRGLEPVDYNAVRIDYSMGTR
jgi:hypothetical protein